MTRTLLTAIFLSLCTHTAFAETVFYCTGTNLIVVDNHKLTEYQTQNFKFRVNQNTLKFGAGGYFNNQESKITTWGGATSWASQDKFSNITFNSGYFTSSDVWSSSNKAYLITAKCDEF